MTIEVTDEARLAAYFAARKWATDHRHDQPDDRMLDAAIDTALAIVEREYVILPRGAQALCCGDHPDVPVRWGTCPACLALMPPEDRT